MRADPCRPQVFGPASAYGGEFQLTTRVTDDRDLEMVSRGVVSSIEPYPQIREFLTLLERLPESGHWKRKEFVGYTNAGDCEHSITRFHFRHRGHGIAFGFSPDEWEALKSVFQEALGSPEMVPILTELHIQYGSP